MTTSGFDSQAYREGPGAPPTGDFGRDREYSPICGVSQTVRHYLAKVEERVRFPHAARKVQPIVGDGLCPENRWCESTSEFDPPAFRSESEELRVASRVGKLVTALPREPVVELGGEDLHRRRRMVLLQGCNLVTLSHRASGYALSLRWVGKGTFG